ncbi:transcriptional regulator [Rivularia sp. PCC 7116]|uniref:LysR family transcriptional regulator n=1 Tax=Rivularia sp. PCC 7116 TaxID=373994 RepID=UPI00029EDA43|nr:LysR family transcriptional regulator [Rivularia sp. PCC 7116]AFY57306.1 transcriptional regulator [Rivularia sp. PCC 7116]
MKSLSNIKTFVRVAQTKSFVEAANVLSLSPPATSKAVAKLEEELGVKLLHRTTRSVSLTNEGERFYEVAQRLLEEMDDLVQELKDTKTEPSGRLKVSMSTAYGRMWGTILLAQFRRDYPQISVDLSLDDRDVDLAAEGFDVVIRVGELADSANLIARRLFLDPLITCATPEYLERYGRPQHPEELAQYNCLNFRNRKTGRLVPWFFTIDEQIERRNFTGTLTIDDGEAVGQAAMLGMGISQMPGFMAINALTEGKLEEILADYRPPEVPFTALYLERRLVSPRIQAFIDFMVLKGAIWAVR